MDNENQQPEHHGALSQGVKQLKGSVIMSIKIEKNVPMPTRAVNKPRAEKYPELRQLEVGDSFMVPIGAPALANHVRRVAKDTGRKFLVRSVIGETGANLGARVWRKA